MQGTPFELRDAMVRAGAGAGKTRGLVEKVAEVYRGFSARGELPRIVLTTFTRKATQELKERLVLKACRERNPGFLSFVSDPARLQISTIHGLLNIFLKQVGHLAGMDSGFQILSEAEAARLSRQALRDCIVNEPSHLRWLETYGFQRVLQMCRRVDTAFREQGELGPATLADIQRAAATEIESWTARLTELSARILEEVDDPQWQAYALALRDKMEGWSGDPADIEGFPSKPRRNNKKGSELEPWHQLVEDEIKKFKREMDKPCWNHQLWDEMAAEWVRFERLAQDYIIRLKQMKDGQARFEMSDLELKSIEIIREKPFLATVFAESWDFFMIDEYQDTSPLQVACLKALTGGKPRYFVGDPQQSIYLFRGAEVGVFNEAEDEIRAAGGEVKELLRNYRSQPDLLLWINEFMASLSREFVAMSPREDANMSSRHCVTMRRATDAGAELQAVVARVGELVASGARLDQICILGRTHQNLMDVSRALKAFGYPTHVHSSRGFSSRREVTDAQALWKFLVNPHDNLNLLTLLRSPWFYCADAQLQDWMADRPPSLWRKLHALSEAPESVLRLRAALNRAGDAGLVRGFAEGLVHAGYVDLALVNDPAGRKESNFWKLILQAFELEKDGSGSVLDFLDEAGGADLLDSAEGDATSAQEPNCINLMTIHGSKGLEFEHVILPRMGEAPRTSSTECLNREDSTFFFPVWSEAQGEFVPSPLDYVVTRRQRERELKEFDRWLYVALTRAKSSLTLTWSEVGSESWAARSEWFSRPAGEYVSPDGRYRFVIEEQWGEPVAYQGQTGRHVQPRAPWRTALARQDERQSVTDLVERRRARAGHDDLLRRWRAQSLGSRIHRAFEALKYGHEPSEAFKDPVSYVLQIEDPPMRQLIAEGYSEWGFQVRTPKGVIEGQIDLWAKHNDRTVIVDYKSGSQKDKEAAFTQLSLYAWALRKFGHQEAIDMLVIYPLAHACERREFTEDLFAQWEREFGLA